MLGLKYPKTCSKWMKQYLWNSSFRRTRPRDSKISAIGAPTAQNRVQKTALPICIIIERIYHKLKRSLGKPLRAMR